MPDRDAEDAGALQINGVSVPQRRLLGAYYTPDDVARLLAQWAVVGQGGRVLDPSFGGCAFMQAAASHLKRKGRRQPGRLVFGVDVDDSCMRYVRESPDLVVDNVVFRNFLAIRPSELSGAPFHAIVGNPPFSPRPPAFGRTSFCMGSRSWSPMAGSRCWCRRQSSKPTTRELSALRFNSTSRPGG